jgi:hypothetical protein
MSQKYLEHLLVASPITNYFVSRSAMEATANDAPFSAESYFATQPAPPELEEAIQGVKEFLDRNLKQGRKVVLITVSGATRAVHTH